VVLAPRSETERAVALSIGRIEHLSTSMLQVDPDVIICMAGASAYESIDDVDPEKAAATP
jgi:hypothetical protein